MYPRLTFTCGMVLGFFAISVVAQSTVSPREQKISQAAESLREKLVEQRRDFHIHPELSNREARTARVVADRLRELGMNEIRTDVAHHGVVALLKGNKPGPVVAVRADMDALPIHETLDAPYKSQTPNVKHACGHDVHTTVQLGVAEVLSKMRDEISGTIKFIFQPAEEGHPAGEEGGAPLMIKEGALKNPEPAAMFALHCSPEIEVGKVGYRSGSAQASSDSFDITIKGKMSHGAMPHKGVDSIVVAAECVTALQSIRSRRTDTFDPLVVTVGTIQGGTRRNILAAEVNMEGTVRTLSEEARDRVGELIEQILDGVTRAHGASYEWKLTKGAPVVVNDPQLAENTLPDLRRVLGETNVVEVPQRMGAEDFAYYQKLVPGFYFRLGTGNSKKGITNDLHTAEFDVDEECLIVGTKVMANVLLGFLERNAGTKN